MKKIIRIASVIALACASLVYVGCTKDFSADIAKTNSDVSALKSKVDALDATVQTINSTVANLQTTKADVTYVDAADKVLGGKIDDLTAELAKVKGTAEQAVADAAKANEAAAKVAEDLKNAKEELDSIIAGVNEKIETLEVNTDSLRKDVDSLYKNSADFENRISALEGKVTALAARVTSIVAIPSTTEEIKTYSIDTVNAQGAIPGSVNKTIFSSNFAVTPKEAASNITASKLKLFIKEGLTKAESTDSLYSVSQVIADPAKGIITVVASVKSGLAPSEESNKLYYSASFTDTDAASKEYGVNSAFVAASIRNENIDFAHNIAKIVVDDEAVESYHKADTLAWNKKASFTRFLTNLEVKAAFGDGFISMADFAKMVGLKEYNLAVKVDSAFDAYKYINNDGVWTLSGDGDAAANDGKFNGIKITSTSVTLDSTDATLVGAFSRIKYYRISVGGETIYGDGNTGGEKNFDETHVIGYVVDEPVVLGGKTAEWTPETWATTAKTYSIIEGAAAKKAAELLGNNTLKYFGKTVYATIKKISTNGVDVYAEAIRADEDYTENISWKEEIHTPLTPADSIIYQINFDFTVKAGPKGAEIDLGEKDTTATGSTLEIPVDADIVALTFAEFAKVYPVADTTTVIDSIKAASVVADSVAFNGKKFAGTVTFTNGKFTINNHGKKAGKYEIFATSYVCGIEYTYTYVVNVNKPSVKFAYNPAFTTKEADGSYSIKVNGKKSGAGWNPNYVITTAPFKDYFNLDSKEIKEGLVVRFAQVDSTASKGETVLPEIAQADSTHFGNGNVEWGTYDSLNVNIKAYLVAGNDTIDEIKILFHTDDPISVTAKTATIEHQYQRADRIDLDSLFTMVDFNDSTVWNKDGAVTYRGAVANYGQIVEYAPQAEWTVNGEPWSGQLSLTIEEGNILRLAANQAEIVVPQVVRIPVLVSHKLNKFGDNYPEYIEVTFE